MLADVRSALADQLPPAMVPTALVAVPAIPSTGGGKVDVAALRTFRSVPRKTGAGAVAAGPVPALTPVQAAIATVWTELLGVVDPRPTDDFFALGGHSLLTFQLVYRLREALGVELPVRTPFQRPTLAGLAGAIEELLAQPAPTDTAPDDGPAWTGPPPASSAQARLWFVQQLDPTAFHYNVPIYASLDGRLDVAALTAAIDGVVARHAPLRTVFATVDGTLRQLVQSPQPIPVEQLDLRSEYTADAAAADQHVHQLAEAAYRRPFDLSRDIPIRLSIIALTDERHVILLTLHHIAYDAWSLKIFFDELAAGYAAHAQGRPLVVPPLTTEYVDYALAQQRQLEKGSLTPALEYWRRQLDGVEGLSGLPLDRPRPTRPSFVGERLSFRIEAETTAALRRLGTMENATLFMLLVTALAVAMAERSGDTDVAIGTDVASRAGTEVERLIGFFVNQVVLRCGVESGLLWRVLVNRVRTTVLDAYAHQHVPFDQVVRAINPRRSREQSSLFSSKIVLNNAPAAPGSLTGLQVTALPFELRTARFDLTVLLEESDGGIDGIWEYDGEIFDARGMSRLCARFVALVDELSTQPDRRPSVGVREASVALDAPAPKQHRARLRRKPTPVSGAGPDVTREPAEPATAGVVSYLRRRPGIELATWARAHRAEIEADLAVHGAVLFRGFDVTEPEAFEAFAAQFVDQLLTDNGEHPRAVIGGSGNVYTPVFFAPEEKLLWHNENTFNATAPARLFFSCAQVAETGGQTPISDSRAVFDAIPAELRDRFVRLGVRYVRVYLPELGVPWQDVFGTSDRALVEERCRRSGITWSWEADTLRTECVRPAAIRHPVSGDWCWTNQAQHWHHACLPEAARAALRDVVSHDRLPRDCTYGDGSPMADEDIRRVLAVYAEHERSFDWRVGDLFMIDNVRCAHARNSYTGARRLLVTMGGEVENR
ncbi:condensation domain-containing protein [Jatrophihabitans lederbergiae]|uniref:Condensation domain-containing protein n=1 Tax=Jatrophihabitans lederbergiae TaxID=3075547 RepID=A0ABU2JCW8_9ACTN|nr:condensation domain-containing protein [Jatrophihabitans sp. DSM 44399]MDT0262309.1 condensation domain-containing protein [Jatrophihabitans sp. DSM 44399]